ncbi:hypothetical protein ACHAQJ_006992 [Trichoderma viride]
MSFSRASFRGSRSDTQSREPSHTTTDWKGFKIQDALNGGFSVLSPTNVILMETESPLKATSRNTGRDGTSESFVDEAELLQFKVLGRCRHMYHTEKFSFDTMTGGQNSKRSLTGEIQGCGTPRTIEAAYIGFGMDMEGPVFARMDAGNGIDPADHARFTLKGMALKAEPSDRWVPNTTVGLATIPHYGVTIKENLQALKNLVNGEPVNNIFDDERLAEQFRLMALLQINCLIKGECIYSIMKRRAYTSRQFPPGADVHGQLQDNSKPPGKGNRFLSHIICDAEILARDSNDPSPSGYMYPAPLTEALEYPQELISLLVKFAHEYPNDILPLRTLLLACHLWYDTTQHPNYQLEKFMQEKKKAEQTYCRVPLISLAVCLVYFQHWVRWVQWMALAEFVHPFRFFKKALETDLRYDGLSVTSEDIDESKVAALMQQVTTRVPLIDPNHRVYLLPCMMPGTRMPPLYNLAGCRWPHKIELSLTGLTNIHYYGFDRYARPDRTQDAGRAQFERPSKYVNVILPKYVNGILPKPFGTSLPSQQEPVPSENNTRSLLSDIELQTMFPHWKPNKARATVNLPPLLIKCIPPSWDRKLDEYIPQHILQGFIQKHRYQFERLVNEGRITVNGSNKMMVDSDLMWVAQGTRSPNAKDFEKPPARYLCGPDVRFRDATPSTVYSEHESVVENETPEPDDQRYQSLMEDWSKVPDGVHWAWIDGLSQLKSLLQGGRQESVLRQLVTDAQQQEQNDHKMLRGTLCAMEGLQTLSDGDLDTKIPLLFGRLLGLQPPGNRVSDIWYDHFVPLATGSVLQVAFVVCRIMAGLRNTRYRPEQIETLRPRMESLTNELIALLQERFPKDWFGEWQRFVVEVK